MQYSEHMLGPKVATISNVLELDPRILEDISLDKVVWSLQSGYE